MLFLVDARVNPRDMSADELWSLWEKEADVILSAKAAGKIEAVYKVAGQRRAIIVLNADSHEELDRLFTAGVPIAHYLEVHEIAPVREYAGFVEDVARRWR